VDITYIPTAEGWLYLAWVTCAREKIVGSSITDHPRTELVGDALAASGASREPVVLRL
jgi:hypothetical protein